MSPTMDVWLIQVAVCFY